MGIEYKIPRALWRDIKEQQPRMDDICIVTDGEDATVAVWKGPEEYEKWYPVGVSGYEWEFDMEPTHWMPFNIELPSEDSTR